jgi:hypothetical protein
MRAVGLAITLVLATGIAVARAPSTPDKLLAGRTAGESVQCIDQSRIIDTYTFDDNSIFYRMNGAPDYLQRPQDCRQLDSDSTYVTDTHSNQLCAGDSLRIFQSGSHVPKGNCLFDKFVPYSKKKRAQ